MKAWAIVPAAVAAILTFNVSAATSQQVCGKEYQACMQSCGSHPSKGTQEGCFQGCEARTNICSERVYGKRPANMPPGAAAAEAKAPVVNKSESAPAKQDEVKEVEAAKEETAKPEEQLKPEAKSPQDAKASAVAKQAVEERASRKRRH